MRRYKVGERVKLNCDRSDLKLCKGDYGTVDDLDLNTPYVKWDKMGSHHKIAVRNSHLTLVKMKFKVGDEVTTDTICKAVITSVVDEGYKITYQLANSGTMRSVYTWSDDELTLVKEESMSKYDELKRKIEDLNNGWTKDADDIYHEILTGWEDHSEKPVIAVSVGQIYVYAGWTYTMKNTQHFKAVFNFETQCEKNNAWKKVLLWMLDNSSIKDEKEKRDSRRKEIDAEIGRLQEEWRKL